MMHQWKNSLGNHFSIEEIISVIFKYPTCQIHIGTDSHYKSGKLIFASVIALYSPGECSRYFYKKRLEKVIKHTRKNLSSRLLQEVQNSIDIASMVRGKIGNNKNISVHADISSNSKNRSNVVHDPARQWIIAMGFNCLMKPKAWASSSIADLHAK